MISVVIPSNRCDAWLEHSIDSVLSSICDVEVEVLLVLNNLNPVELSKVPDFESKYGDRVNLVVLENVTLVDALNFGIRKSKFDFIARLDSDDTMSGTRLQKQYDFLRNNTNVALVGSAVNLMDENSKVIGFKIYPLDDTQISSCLRFGNCFAHPSVMFRKEIFNHVGGYSNEFLHSEDFDLFTRLSRDFSLVNLPEKLTTYRVSSNQISSRYLGVQEVNSLRILEREYQLRIREPHFKLYLESQLLKARYARARSRKVSLPRLFVWTFVGLLLNFSYTFQYVNQFSLNSRLRRSLQALM